ncbi:MAG: glutamate synthase-related protein, partial [Pseudomonadota bacterium]
SYGTTAVRGFVDLTEEAISFAGDDTAVALDGETDPLRLLTLRQMEDAFGIDDAGYVNTSFEKLKQAQIDSFEITPGYRAFSRMMAEERHKRPAALRDVLAFPADITFLDAKADIKREMMLFNREGNIDFVIRGLMCEALGDTEFLLRLTGPKAGEIARLDALAQSLLERFGADIEGHYVTQGALKVAARGWALDYLSRLRPAPERIELDKVQPAHEITARLASGAMSHGALVATAHEAVAHGTNMAGGMSNSGEGGEHISRYGTIRASRIKQFASGRFGVWAGYLADPNLEELEIKIGQGAKPGEGGQLPAPKVTVEIAAARGGTPGVELVSPPPHHDTYSIEDLAQLIHDCKAARKRVIVKLVSSEGIGTIAVGVAKAGADVINVAGNTGGTGAASVTSLKYTGRAAEIGIAEVHQALCANGIRQKVILRCSGAMQTGSDVVKASLMGGDSFEFGTTALMMLKCVMAKNCNVKCPAGLTTNPEVFDGDPRALAQYLLNISHEVREILATLGFKSLDEARGRSDLLHLLDHPASVGQLNLRLMLQHVQERRVSNPVYLERDFAVDDALIDQVRSRVIDGGETAIELRPNAPLNTRNKTVGGQLAVDIERILNHDLEQKPDVAFEDARGRRFLDYRAIRVVTQGAAGQSFGAFCNDGMVMDHTGTCNDGVGKGACGGEIIVRAPAGGGACDGQNVLIGNFALFGATGGRTFIEGEAGDRFAVRNSGATAVVEGVGDFCAEYMTNGAILNLGGFSKGYGNGMSGGFAYQYDPEGRLPDMLSQDSVFTGTLGDDSIEADIHQSAVRQLLEWHVEATGSGKARALLADWENARADFAWIMPKALLQYQDSDEILAARSRKDLIEELATALCAHQISELKGAWKQGKPVHRGATPAVGDTGSEDMYRLINSYTVLETAQLLAAKRVGPHADPVSRDKAVRNLILTEDFGLTSALAKHARAAVSDYDDPSLATLVAHKRLSDFKRALSLRNILSMDSPGTYAWILHQSAKNRSALGEIPSFDELFAKNALPDVAARQAAE